MWLWLQTLHSVFHRHDFLDWEVWATAFPQGANVCVPCCFLTLPGAVPVWSWCYGGHQTIPSVRGLRTHYKNSVNNRHVGSPRLHVRPPVVTAHLAAQALRQTHTRLCTVSLRPTTLGRRKWKCDSVSPQSDAKVKDWTSSQVKKKKDAEQLRAGQFVSRHEYCEVLSSLWHTSFCFAVIYVLWRPHVIITDVIAKIC